MNSPAAALLHLLLLVPRVLHSSLQCLRRLPPLRRLQHAEVLPEGRWRGGCQRCKRAHCSIRRAMDPSLGQRDRRETRREQRRPLGDASPCRVREGEELGDGVWRQRSTHRQRSVSCVGIVGIDTPKRTRVGVHLQRHRRRDQERTEGRRSSVHGSSADLSPRQLM